MLISKDSLSNRGKHRRCNLEYVSYFEILSWLKRVRKLFLLEVLLRYNNRYCVLKKNIFKLLLEKKNLIKSRIARVINKQWLLAEKIVWWKSGKMLTRWQCRESTGIGSMIRSPCVLLPLASRVILKMCMQGKLK